MPILKIKNKTTGEWEELPVLAGPQGEPGVTPQITIGVIETLPAGSEATASITGTSENPQLNLGIPRGNTGVTEESDPTVPEWAKQPEKPTYTADEVGAQPEGDYALKSEIVKSINGIFPDENGDIKINEWELIQDIKINEACAFVNYDVDLNGNPFKLKKAVIYVYRTTTSVPELAVSLDASV